jgi:hypothetical protein
MVRLVRSDSPLAELPFHNRVIIRAIIMLLRLCGRNTRISALMGLLAREAHNVTETREEYEEIIDVMGNYMKIEHLRITAAEKETA